MARDALFSKVPIALLEDPEADAYTVAVYAALKSKCDFGSETGAKVSDRAAAKLAGCSPRTFRDRRVWLRDRGWISWEGKYGATNRYIVRDRPRQELPGSGGETAARDAGAEGETSASAAAPPAGNAAPPRREMPTTENQYREPPRENAREARGGEGETTAEKDWQFVRRKMRDRRAPILGQLSERGSAALEAIGGVEALVNTRPVDVRHLRRDFLQAHRNGQGGEGEA